ncbi:AraC family transcriptional regulator [Nostoc flagelliforme FACHB-838]|uniref:AraC family transcriptional regulator n=1 Tax=Nostoc flagelliforme FACHB-838 TaxID=2692904 RepID=A0ABR8DJI0_9NOSO|nr:AraC family transcriptional regulator [Nostoc flagelliforme]MBD2529055.1 AraC family transcriptional regulator [Nostoc flagelliforme FACHB-838]
MKEATFSVSIVRDIVQYAATSGIDAKKLCTAAGIELALIEMPDQQITGAPLRALWREVVKLTGDENFGLHLGEAFNAAAIGIVGYVLLNCNTFDQVLEKLSRYTRLFSQGVYINFTVFEGQVLCDCEIVDYLKNYLLEEPRHPIESTFAALMTVTKMLTGKQLYPQTVWFQHPRPNDISEHERIFRSSIRFFAPTNRMILDANCLHWPVLSANPSLLSIFEQYAKAMLHELSQENTYSNLVVQTISQQLKGEVPTLKIIAHNLAISVRNLQRELQTEGTSYQQLLDATRKELALRHLKKTDASIHDVAFLLGFSEPSAFHRAFKRWTGKTPQAYRG